MLDQTQMTRQEAIDRLRDFGIQGEQVYLIDLIPLVEMIWADGSAQRSEVAIFESYLEQHVKRVNALAGYSMLTVEAAQTFIQGFLDKRPSEKLLQTLRSLIPLVRLVNSAEHEAIPLLKEAIAHCEAVRDYVSRDLFAEILSNEEEHVDFLEKQFEMIKRMGLPNYVQLQSEAAGA